VHHRGKLELFNELEGHGVVIVLSRVDEYEALLGLYQ